MAFKGRGSLSGGNNSISRSINAKRSGVTYDINHYHVHVYRDYSEYLMCRLVSFFVISAIIVVSILIAVFTYESTYIYDPLAEMKNIFFDIKFFGIVVSIMLTILSFSKLKTRSAFKVIIAGLVCLLISVLISGHTLITLENKNNELALVEIYNESYFKVDVVGEKQDLFIRECQKLNGRFQLKVVTICIMEYMLIFVNFFLLISEAKMKKKYDQAQKENEVLFDEEQNVKI